jgi:hypothetical protein
LVPVPANRRQQLELLVIGERGRLTGGAGDDQAVRAVLDEVARDCTGAFEVERAVLGERGHHRRDHA